MILFHNIDLLFDNYDILSQYWPDQAQFSFFFFSPTGRNGLPQVSVLLYLSINVNPFIAASSKLVILETIPQSKIYNSNSTLHRWYYISYH